MPLSDIVARYGWPICVKCGKPVDRILEERDVLTDEIIVSVVCHGATQTVRVSPETLLVPSVKIRFTRAFVDEPALPSRPGVFVTQSGRPQLPAARETPAVPVPGLRKTQLVTSLADFVEVCDTLVDEQPNLREALDELTAVVSDAALNKPHLFPLQLTPPAEEP